VLVETVIASAATAASAVNPAAWRLSPVAAPGRRADVVGVMVEADDGEWPEGTMATSVAHAQPEQTGRMEMVWT
jgi:hypothetical protein